ncbi:cyanidin 3-O-galactoside 2''-O-xylosyltransferase FGGT1-like [Corylus avellana]|uniref:cyanidin 3-O-galactoside 2''-O-xylosyltransferase FGGT1-like n=1 Tax=Corylus avellana TaxID=13451 RepID=UPI001E2032BB|nr:cyanidin 3-O-galactoside 2''-O-xylosyltransferase FGGT1-like [Corylus avellana]
MASTSLHLAMYPWFAFGHLSPFLHLSNKLAQKGHTISFFIPTNTQPKLEPFNLYPDHITFVPITLPHVDGLPSDAETTSDVPFTLYPHLMTAMDRTETHIDLLLHDLKPDIVLFDFAYWVPKLARNLGIKSIAYSVVSAAAVSYIIVPARQRSGYHSEADFIQPPSGFPVSSIKLHVNEARLFAALSNMKFGSDVLFLDRLFTSLDQSDAVGFWSCREIDGPCIDYFVSQFEKPVLVSGPIIVDPPASTLEEKWVEWLGSFTAGSVIYCALGSECKLEKDQFQELVLGLELCGWPFLAALKPPIGAESVEAALPEGFLERIKGKGMVHGRWVQQRLILGHPSIGCFVTHCGSGSLMEALRSECQLVMLPQTPDQIISARMMANNWKVGVEIEKGELEDGLFTKVSVSKAVRSVMEVDSEVGRLVRANHGKLRELLLSVDLQSSYIDDFSEKLKDMVR